MLSGGTVSKRLFRFDVEVIGDVVDNGIMPIYDEFGYLAGGCLLKEGNVLRCFVSGEGYPAALKLSSDDQFFMTARSSEFRCVTHCILSERPLDPSSVLVRRADELEVIIDSALEARDEEISER